MEKCFFCTTDIVMSLPGSNPRPHISVTRSERVKLIKICLTLLKKAAMEILVNPLETDDCFSKMVSHLIIVFEDIFYQVNISDYQVNVVEMSAEYLPDVNKCQYVNYYIK